MCKKKERTTVCVLFRNRSNRCRDVGMTCPFLSLSLLSNPSPSFHSLSLLPLFFRPPFSSYSRRVSPAEADALTSPLYRLSYGRHYGSTHTLLFPIFVSPSHARARICAKGPLHLVHRSRTQLSFFFSISIFFYVRAFLSSCANGRTAIGLCAVSRSLCFYFSQFYTFSFEGLPLEFTTPFQFSLKLLSFRDELLFVKSFFASKFSL